MSESVTPRAAPGHLGRVGPHGEPGASPRRGDPPREAARHARRPGGPDRATAIPESGAPRDGAPSPTPGPAPPGETLRSVILRRVLPGLRARHGRAEETRPLAPSRAHLRAEDRELFLGSLRTGSEASAPRVVEQLRRRGVPVESLLFDLLPDTARRLGALWDRDDCDFTEVTVAVLRMHRLLRAPGLAGATPPGWDEAGPPRVLLASIGADSHLLGLGIVSEVFRRDGWSVRIEPGASRQALSPILEEACFDLLGLSLPHDAPDSRLAADLRALRVASRNAGLRILVGGQRVAATPELGRRIGADAAVVDGRDAARVGRGILAARRRDPEGRRGPDAPPAPWRPRRTG